MTLAIEVRGLRLAGRHGVDEAERARPQRFAVDVTLGLADAPVGDRLEETVDYRVVAEVVREVVENRSFSLVETLAATTADELLARFPRVDRARVRVEKLDVELAAKATPRVSVERARSRP